MLAGDRAWMRRATANILVTLDGPAIAKRINRLTARADIVALQEWPRSRNGILRDHGGIAFGPILRTPRTVGDWQWTRPLIGGSPIGVRREHGETLIACKAVVLVGPGRVENDGGKRRAFLGVGLATRTKWRRRDGSIVIRYVIHLTAGIDAGKGIYRDDRPLRVARHKAERRSLDKRVRRDLKRGHDVEVYGDTNFHRMAIPGLIAWWVIDDSGTLGHRAIDGIWTLTEPEAVDFLPALSPQEHRSVITTTEENR